jgi:hypothetical protein
MARRKLGLAPPITLNLRIDQMKRIENFRFQYHYPSRLDAIRELIDRGLDMPRRPFREPKRRRQIQEEILGDHF